MAIETKALTGIHTPKAFTQRIWMNFDTVKLTYYLFKFVVGDYVTTQMYKKTHAEERVMNFFYKCIGGQCTRRMYMLVLVEVALVFNSLSAINEQSIDFPKHCQEGSETQFVSNVKRMVSCYDECEKLTRYTSAYLHLDKLGRQVKYTSMTHSRHKENKYQTFRCMIFKMWFHFQSNKRIQQKVFNLLYPTTV